MLKAADEVIEGKLDDHFPLCLANRKWNAEQYEFK